MHTRTCLKRENAIQILVRCILTERQRVFLIGIFLPGKEAFRRSRRGERRRWGGQYVYCSPLSIERKSVKTFLKLHLVYGITVERPKKRWFTVLAGILFLNHSLCTLYSS